MSGIKKDGMEQDALTQPVSMVTDKSSNSKKSAKADKAVSPQTPESRDVVATESKDQIVFTPEDKVLLAKQESVIASNIGAFLLIGEALSVIKGRDLQKVSDPELTFDQYCSKKWGFGQAYAYRLISGYECVKHLRDELSPKGVVVFPANEAQVRPLAKLKPKDQVKIWYEVLKKAKAYSITAAMVEEAVNGEVNQTTKPKTAKNSAAAAAKAGQKLKTIGQLVEKALKVKPEKRNLKQLTKLLEEIQKLIYGKKS